MQDYAVLHIDQQMNVLFHDASSRWSGNFKKFLEYLVISLSGRPILKYYVKAMYAQYIALRKVPYCPKKNQVSFGVTVYALRSSEHVI